MIRRRSTFAGSSHYSGFSRHVGRIKLKKAPIAQAMAESWQKDWEQKDGFIIFLSHFSAPHLSARIGLQRSRSAGPEFSRIRLQ
jgi:hypothetical protein